MGFVYLRFENAQASMGAQRALHGRWFAGKMITATYMVHDLFHFKTVGFNFSINDSSSSCFVSADYRDLRGQVPSE